MKQANFTDNISTARVNVSPPIFLMEDHDQAYHIWRDMGMRDKLLIHIDAHMDFAWFAQCNPLSLLEAESLQELNASLKETKVWNPSPDPKDTEANVGNYIYPAVTDGIVKKFYWVVPDDFLSSARRILYFKKMVARIMKRIPGHRARVTAKGSSIITEFHGCEIIVCALDSLPSITEDVLLDIDTDFFTSDFDRVRDTSLLQLKKRMPWMLPDELADVLRKKQITAELVTIAYSVEKHFTPIEFKYLGDDLKALLADAPLSDDARKAMWCRNRAMASKYAGGIDEALAYLDEAISLEPERACNYYNAAQIQYEAGMVDAARKSYQKAICLDKTYRSRYNNVGQIYRRFWLVDKMAREYQRLLALDPDDPSAHSGCGEALLMKNKVVEARKEIERALALDPHDLKALHLLAEICENEKKADEAISLLENVVARDPGDLGAYLNLSRLYHQQGMADEAIDAAKNAFRLGFCDTALYLRLCSCYCKKRAFLRAFRAFCRACYSFPLEIFIRIKRRPNGRKLLKTILE